MTFRNNIADKIVFAVEKEKIEAEIIEEYSKLKEKCDHIINKINKRKSKFPPSKKVKKDE